jgi:hypothetical protein
VSKYQGGPLTIAGWKAHQAATGESLQVFLDGVNVTHRCRFADNVAGRVELLCADLAHHRDWRIEGPGHLTPDAGELGPHWLSVSGAVEIRP